MNDVVYGKTMENLRNKIDVRLVSKDKDHLKSKMDIKTKLYVSKKYLTMISSQHGKEKLH